jgi:hypothetical protein
MPWQVTYQGETYRESDLTIGQCEALEELIGLSWLSLNPLRSAKQARILTAFVVAEGTGRPFDEVSAEIAALKADDYLKAYADANSAVLAIEPEPDDLPSEWTDGIPPKAAVPSTSTS